MQTYTFGMYNHLETIQEESRTGFCNQNVVVAGDPAQQGHKKGKACAFAPSKGLSEPRPILCL